MFEPVFLCAPEVFSIFVNNLYEKITGLSFYTFQQKEVLRVNSKQVVYLYAVLWGSCEFEKKKEEKKGVYL